VRGFFQTGMAMKPSKTFFLSKISLRVSFFHFHSQQLTILAYLRARTMSPGDHTRECHGKFAKHLSFIKIRLPTFGLARTRLRDERFDESERQTLVGIGKANVRHQKKVLDNVSRPK
jgi:hypothetical protein